VSQEQKSIDNMPHTLKEKGLRALIYRDWKMMWDISCLKNEEDVEEYLYSWKNSDPISTRILQHWAIDELLAIAKGLAQEDVWFDKDLAEQEFGSLWDALVNLFRQDENAMIDSESNVSQSDTSAEPNTFLPYTVQHKLLSKVQHILENCLFTYAKREHPELMSTKHLDCPEAADVPTWIRTIQIASEDTALKTNFAALNDGVGTKSIESLLHLRTVIVDRKKVSSDAISSILKDSRHVVTLLHDDTAQQDIMLLENVINLLSHNFRRQSDILEERYKTEMEGIKKMRQTLDDREVTASKTLAYEKQNAIDAMNVKYEDILKSITENNIVDPAAVMTQAEGNIGRDTPTVSGEDTPMSGSIVDVSTGK